MFPRWLVTFKVALPSPICPMTRRPSLTNRKPELASEPSEILRVEGAVATIRNEDVNGIRKLMLPRVEAKR